MRIHSKTKGVKGIVSVYNHVIKMKYMIKEEAKRKARIITFYDKYGLEATKEAFNVGRSTIFLWKKQLKNGNNSLISLNNKSRAPINKRKRIVEDRTIDLIIKYRQEYGRLSKDKVSVLLKEEHNILISNTKVGRILTDLKKQGRLPEYTKLSLSAKSGRLIENNVVKKKKNRLKKYKSTYTGDVVQIDTVVRFINGVKRYTLTAIDTYGRFAFALTYKNHSSKESSDFINKLIKVFPSTITKIQTDNGSEFMYLFEDILKKHKITHYNIYPRTPKMNAFIERFNRTLNEEFLKSNRELCAYNLEEFNRKLIDYLVWYNTKRPHYSLGLLSPLQFLMLEYKKSNMWWRGTKA